MQRAYVCRNFEKFGHDSYLDRIDDGILSDGNGVESETDEALCHDTLEAMDPPLTRVLFFFQLLFLHV